MVRQEIFKNIQELIFSNKLYHSLIVSCTNQEELDFTCKEITRMIVCENSSIENDNCRWCKKVNSMNALNIFFIGDGFSNIKKEEISNLIINFSSSNIEDSDKKIYIIRNAENLSDRAANSLLKFLEEPPKNVFAILQTKDKNQILQTIKSRCKLLNLTHKVDEEIEDKEFFELMKSKNKNFILLYSDKFKKLDKADQVKILEYTFKNFIQLEMPNLSELFLDTIIEIKNSNYTNLTIENLFIKIFEVL
ncbi:DNA polymerase III subunit delta' [Spiroplasma chinense]|uniref:DNA polymerase III subunit delta n=2 Tax=Spiroplasma chinense TaxID=216932 RepID=A0A5B9Y2B9_9MOLU|nr:DNA polymerase III subunit delta' [Spiroplasma chinense]